MELSSNQSAELIAERVGREVPSEGVLGVLVADPGF